MFDVNTFLNTAVTAQLDTVRPQHDPGEFPGVIEKMDFKSGTSEKNGQPWASLNIQWKFEEDKPRVFQSLFLDMTPSGGLDIGKGKNVPLGQLREALGQNKPDQPWSPSMLIGGAARCVITQDMYAPKDGSEPYPQSNISRVKGL